MRDTHQNFDQEGFTLIETLIAMTILAIALLGLARMQFTAIQGNRFSLDVTEATAFASEGVEMMLWQTNSPNVVCFPNDNRTVANLTFTRTCALAPGDPGDRAVLITVSWLDRNATPKNVALTTEI